MRRNHHLLALAASAVVLGGLGAESDAAIVMIDFGSGGTSLYSSTNSPAHAAGAIPLSYTTWVAVGATDGSFSDSDSNVISYDLGRAPTLSGSDSNIVNYTNQPALVSGTAGAGIWSTVLTTDGLQDIAPGNRRDPVAIRLSGLAPGTYDAFLVAHYSANTSVPLDVGYLVSTSASITSFGSMTGVASLTPDVNTATWDESSDYYRKSITINAGDYLYFMVRNPDNSGTVLTNKATIASLQLTNESGPPLSSIISISASPAHANLATGGEVSVAGSGGFYSSEIDELTGNANLGSAVVNNVGNEGPTFVMLWLNGTGGDIDALLAALDGQSGYDIAGAGVGISDPLYAAVQELQAMYGGGPAGNFSALVRFDPSVSDADNDAFNWDFAAHPAVVVDKIAVVPEPASIGLLALGSTLLLGRRRRMP